MLTFIVLYTPNFAWGGYCTVSLLCTSAALCWSSRSLLPCSREYQLLTPASQPHAQTVTMPVCRCLLRCCRLAMAQVPTRRLAGLLLQWVRSAILPQW
jgi:hypothetical protein